MSHNVGLEKGNFVEVLMARCISTAEELRYNKKCCNQQPDFDEAGAVRRETVC